VLLLETNHHATEILADEGLEKLVYSVSVVDVVLFEDLIGEIGAGLEGELLGENEGVVAIEEDILDLWLRRWLAVELWRRSGEG
jgi:hypothetical protein